MKVSDNDLRALWREGAADAPSDRSTCLTDVEWARLLANEASTTERLRAADHVASCAACADEYRLLQPMESWLTEADGMLSPHKAAPAAGRTGWRAWWTLPAFRVAATAATVLLITNAVLLLQVLGTRRQSAGLEAQLAQHQVQLGTPLLDVTVVELEPQRETLRGTPDAHEVLTPAGSPNITLVLRFPRLESRSTIEIEVADADGRVRWIGRTRSEQDTDSLTLALPAASYPVGEYVIRLLDVTRGRRAIATYPVLIRQLQ